MNKLWVSGTESNRHVPFETRNLVPLSSIVNNRRFFRFHGMEEVMHLPFWASKGLKTIISSLSLFASPFGAPSKRPVRFS